MKRGKEKLFKLKGSGAKTVGYEKKKKIPNGIEIYAVKPRVHE
ncbi:hypothetical protein PDR31_28810 [Bacillus cereus]|nr:hypothetical protein [Bacillus thuringiensis]MDA2583445.1 hypothetical protein [Bacillus cereus]MEB8748699.1 hypothetical protein [Bacillus cereus]MEB8763111.1 hypothetical protein [Bacillus cereus]MEB8895892.1 hypothetical protein [Bacillus cereus]MED3392083.1 hypothetical protein [Bacillus thuringiensis]